VFKLLRSGLPLALALCAASGLAHAQSGFDVFLGAGTARVASSNQSIDTFSTGSPYTTPAMGGTFGKAGFDYFFKPQFGVSAETDFRFTQAAYAGLSYRPTFYDFNAIWKPTNARFHHVAPVFQAGLGGMNLSFFQSASSCNAFTGCSNSTQFLDSSNHFQVHLSAGLRMYATRHLFVQPQVDAHYVNNLFQFGSNWVPEYGASVGWSFGER
jgi:outer membrane protein W